MNPNPQMHRGFTLVEIMIVVAIIALLAALAIPNFLRARKRSQATMVREDLRAIESAIDQYAIENGKIAGDTVSWDVVKLYLKPTTSLYTSGKSIIGGSYMVSYLVDGVISTPVGTGDSLGAVTTLDFWSPFSLIP